MCTAITYNTNDHYFGRNLDLEFTYNEAVTITPRNFLLKFRRTKEIKNHFAIIGMAYVCENYPLYYDATNEKGLSIAALNFPDNAYYNAFDSKKDNITPFELIPWILGQCSTIDDVKLLLNRINLYSENFSSKLKLSPLHWIISDKVKSITLESVETGIKIYDNPVGVLTNNPTFDYHLLNLNNYISLTNCEPINTFNTNLDLAPYSRGMGAIGLPGDFSSTSRFVKAAFVKMNSIIEAETTEAKSISQFFHILKSVEMPRGSVQINNGLYEITQYSSCCNTDKGIYYYTTYENNQICAVDMYNENLSSTTLIQYPLFVDQNINYIN